MMVTQWPNRRFRRSLMAILPAVVAIIGASTASGAPLVYISNTSSDDVWVVDIATEAVVAVIPVGDDPRGIDITPNNSRVYVANRFDNTVSVIDTATNMVVGTIDFSASMLVTATEPYDVVVSADGEWLYVAMKNGGSENGDGTVVVVDLPAHTIVAEVILDSNASPEGIVVTPDGQKVYVAARGAMYIVDVSNPASPMFVGTAGVAERELVVSPDGAFVYSDDNAVRTSDDMAFNTGDTSGERGISISPNGLRLFSTDEDSFVRVVDIDLSGGTPVTSFLQNIDFSPESESYGIDLTDDGRIGVVSFRNSDTVVIFDAVALSAISAAIPMSFNGGATLGNEPKQLVIAHEFEDCNENGNPDNLDISSGASEDCQPNGIPDECEDPCPMEDMTTDFMTSMGDCPCADCGKLDQLCFLFSLAGYIGLLFVRRRRR